MTIIHTIEDWKQIFKSMQMSKGSMIDDLEIAARILDDLAHYKPGELYQNDCETLANAVLAIEQLGQLGRE